MTARTVPIVSLLCAILACTGSRERRLLGTDSPPESPAASPAGSRAGAAAKSRAEVTIEPLVRAAGSVTGPADTRLRRASARSATPARAQPSAPPASETVARALLFNRFREAGFRIRYDVPVREPGRFEFTADGYDPAARVGYEYIAQGERDTDLRAAEMSALGRTGEYRILVLEAAAPEALSAPVERFLARLPDPNAAR